MIKTSELTGAQLDYYVARAEGSQDAMVVRWPTEEVCITSHGALASVPFRPSTQWVHGGPLIEKYQLDVCTWVDHGYYCVDALGNDTDGDTPLQAICRSVVRAAFGDEVEEVAP